MTEEEEIVRFGTIMYRIDKDGNKIHVPRCCWDMSYNPKSEENYKNVLAHHPTSR